MAESISGEHVGLFQGTGRQGRDIRGQGPVGFFQGQDGMVRVRWKGALPETEKGVGGNPRFFLNLYVTFGEN